MYDDILPPPAKYHNLVELGTKACRLADIFWQRNWRHMESCVSATLSVSHLSEGKAVPFAVQGVQRKTDEEPQRSA